MNKSIVSPLLAGFLILALLVYSSFSGSEELTIPESGGVEIAQGVLDLSGDQRQADQFVKSIPFKEALGEMAPEVMGSLAPIALSPFFALTCFSGASLLSDAGLLPDGIMDNFMMSANSPLHNEAVFLGLLALTVLTSLPKLTTVSKTFAQAVDQVEGYSGIIAAVTVQVLSQVTLDDASAAQDVIVYSAGFSLTMESFISVILMVFSAINIFVVNTVKFFFEVMVWISPIPTIDAIFEAANKAFTGLLVTVYLISPTAATVLNLIIFLISLSMFAWIYRRVVYMRSILADPFFGWIAESVFRLRKMTVKSTKLPKSVEEELSDPTVVLKAFIGKKAKGIKKKARGYLVHSNGTTYFVKLKLLGKNRIQPLTGEGIYPEVKAGLLSNSITFTNSIGDINQKILFTKRYNNILNEIHRELNARGDQVGSAEMGGFSSIGKSLGKASDRSNLKSELA